MAAIFRPWLERYLEAHRHAVSGRTVIKRQRGLIARQKAVGRNTEASEDLLASFERTQAIFENDLARIVSAK
jgi:hypothetical protein